MSRNSETYAVVATHQIDLPTGTAYPGDRVKLTAEQAEPFIADGQLLIVEGLTSRPRATPDPEPPSSPATSDSDTGDAS